MDEISEIYKREIRNAEKLKDINQVALLLDSYLNHLKNCGLAFLEEARSMEEEIRLEDNFEIVKIAADSFREHAKLYFAEYTRLLRGQKEGKIPTKTPDFSELELIANRQDFIGQKYLL